MAVPPDRPQSSPHYLKDSSDDQTATFLWSVRKDGRQREATEQSRSRFLLWFVDFAFRDSTRCAMMKVVLNYRPGAHRRGDRASGRFANPFCC